MRRLAAAFVLLWLVVTLTFVLVRLAPGDAAALLVPPDPRPRRTPPGSAPSSPWMRSIAVQYAKWIARAAAWRSRGKASHSDRPVARAPSARRFRSRSGLGSHPHALTFVVGVAIWPCRRRAEEHAVDPSLTFATTAILCRAPSYWLALVAHRGVHLWGDACGASRRASLAGVRHSRPRRRGDRYGRAVVDLVRHAVLPVTVLAAVGAAGIARYARTSTLDVTRRRSGCGRRARRDCDRRARVLAVTCWRTRSRRCVVLLALSLPGIGCRIGVRRERVRVAGNGPGDGDGDRRARLSGGDGRAPLSTRRS